jgi:hypothetical protein
MQKGRGGLGMTKHGKSGKVHTFHHFTGKKAGVKVRRKGKGLTRKQRAAKRGTHINKYGQG